jgi:peptide/nickel transport system substrate-binding protein
VIHPNEYYAKVGPKGMNEKPVGSGPFKVVDHQLGKQLTLERNADYWKDSPKSVPSLQRLVIRFIPDRQTQVAEVLAGGLDVIMNVPIDQAEQMKAVPHVKIVSGETMRIAFLQMNSTPETPAPPLRELKVRQAINHAIDRETMVKTLVGEGSRVLNVICFPSQFGCTQEGVPAYKYDPARAKQLLAEAGFPNGFELDIFSYRERAQAEAFINYLRAVGIKANLRFMQYAAMREQNRTNKAAITHQTWGSFSVNDMSAATPVFFKFIDDDVSKDAEVRDTLDKGDNTINPEERKAAYAKALKLIAERAYAVPLFSLATYYALNKDLEFKAYADEMPRFWEVKWR